MNFEPLSFPHGAAVPGLAGGLQGMPVELLLRVLDEIDYGLLLLDEQAHVRYANQLGLDELRCGSKLMLAGVTVRARHDADQGSFRQALADAHRGRRRLLVSGRGDAAAFVAIVPVPLQADAADDWLALLVFGKRSTARSLTMDFFARSYRLTGAELAVLKALCAGRSPKDIAREQGVALCTVRSHISSVRAKTGSASMRDLINRVAVLPPITPAMKTAMPAAAGVH